jgi:hypothetical protein
MSALDRFAGRYDFGSGVVFDVARDGPVLKVLRQGAPGAQAMPIYPETTLAFFWKAVDAQIRFITDPGGIVTGAEFAQGGVRLTGKRLP